MRSGRWPARRKPPRVLQYTVRFSRGSVSTSRGPCHSCAPRTVSHAAVHAHARVMRPRRRFRRRRRRHGNAGHPHAPACRDQQRPVAAEHPMTLQPPLALQRDWHETAPPDPPTPSHTPTPPSEPAPPAPAIPTSNRRRTRPKLTRHQPLPLPRSPSRLPPHPSAPARPRALTSYQQPAGISCRAGPPERNTWRAGGPARQPTTRPGETPMNTGAGAGRGTPRNPRPSRSRKGMTLRMTAIDNIR